MLNELFQQKKETKQQQQQQQQQQFDALDENLKNRGVYGKFVFTNSARNTLLQAHKNNNKGFNFIMSILQELPSWNFQNPFIIGGQRLTTYTIHKVEQFDGHISMVFPYKLFNNPVRMLFHKKGDEICIDAFGHLKPGGKGFQDWVIY